MFIKIFIMLFFTYYIIRTINPEFYSENIIKGILKRNEDCRSIKDLQEKAANTNDYSDFAKISVLSLFCFIHMWSEFIVVAILTLKYKSLIAAIYLIFWGCIYAKRSIDNKKNKEKPELDRIRATLNNCFKVSNRLIILVDLLFFGYMFFSMIL